MNRSALKYTWLTYRREQLWFPIAFLALFVFISVFMRHPAIRFNLARAYLGFMVPLLGGIAAAYAVLDDPAIELRFATPLSAAETLGTRLGLILGVQTLSALGFEVVVYALRVDLSPLGGLLGLQLVWFTPTLALIAVATFGSLAGAQSAVGAFLAGALWLVQLTMKSWFELNGKYVFLFMGVFGSAGNDLLMNRVVLLVVSVALLLGAWALLHRQERFL
ncbi:MAG: hypothetical protein ABI609_05615 [Acidobacteriota bacterium]